MLHAKAMQIMIANFQSVKKNNISIEFPYNETEQNLLQLINKYLNTANKIKL
jgi:hypothetical protein